MRGNVNKPYIIAFAFICMFLIQISTVYAEETNVLDCLEQGEDCEEEVVRGENEEAEQSAEEIVGSQTFNAGSLFFNIVKMLVALFLILALIYLIVLFLRRRHTFLEQQDVIKNLGGISLGQNKSIQLIRIGSRVYVVGVGDHVDLMFEITDEEILEKLFTEEMETNDAPFLEQFFQKASNSQEATNNFMQQLKSELSRLQKNRQELMTKSTKKDDEHE